MLLIVDILDEARKLEIYVTARGSVGNCLVAYLLGITVVDPIKYKLAFVRFLNRGRMSKDKAQLPDIDLDFDSEKRNLIMYRMRDKYGSDRVAQMGTLGTMGAKSAIKDAFRITATYQQKDEYQAIAERISQYIPPKMPDESEVDLETVIETSETVRKYAEKYPQQFDYAKQFQGCVKNAGIHAAGLLVSPEPLLNHIPMHWNKKTGMMSANLVMEDAEFLGGIKVDCLGLNENSAIAEMDKLYCEHYQ
jgi:DNA polymerase-3 subunit alpha